MLLGLHMHCKVLFRPKTKIALVTGEPTNILMNKHVVPLQVVFRPETNIRPVAGESANILMNKHFVPLQVLLL